MHGTDPAISSDTPVGSPIARADGIPSRMTRTGTMAVTRPTGRHDSEESGCEAATAEGGAFQATRAAHRAAAAE